MDEQILELVKLLKIDKYQIRGNEIKTLCLNPEHDDHNLGNFSINLNNGMFFCFACGYKGSIVYLLSENGTKYTKAIRIWNQLRKVKELYIPALPVDKYIIAAYKRNGISQYALDRVGDENLLKEYDVYSDNWGNPVFLTKNFRGQYTSVWVRENGKYFLVEPLTARRDGCIFGEHLQETEYCYLSEGPFDSMKLRKVTGQKCIAGFGTYLSKAQISKINKIDNLVLFFDGDNAGRNARNRLFKILENKHDIFLTGKFIGDPDELSDEEIKNVLKRKLSNIEYKFYGANRCKNS